MGGRTNIFKNTGGAGKCRRDFDGKVVVSHDAVRFSEDGIRRVEPPENSLGADGRFA